MDIAYDHILEEALSPSSPTTESTTQQPPQPNTSFDPDPDPDPDDPRSSREAAPQQPSSPTLKSDLSSAFAAASSSTWGTTLGSWFSQARKQGETFYQDLQKEASEAQEQATKGLSSLKEQVVQRTRSLSLSAEPGPVGGVPGEEGVPAATAGSLHKREGSSASGADTAVVAEAEALQDQRPESLPADIVKEAGTLVASLRSTAASRLKDLQRAEDAADEALLKFGTNVRNFLRDAVTITAPDGGTGDKEEKEVLFETQEPGTGKKVFHSTRLDAQLHAIHTTATSFTDDPAAGEEWEAWTEEFDIDKKTEGIASDLERYEELRRAMEKLVPEKVEYKAFWMRYYFLRKAVEEEEKRRREVLKGISSSDSSPSYVVLTLQSGAATDPEEEVAWDDEDEDDTSTPNQAINNNKAASESTTTLNATTANDALKAPSPRRSHEDESKSVASSDASYDIVSGATSRATGSPKEEKKEVGKDDSDDDWE